MAKSLRSRIKKIRKQAKMTQSTFAKELCVNKDTLFKIEKGVLNPSYKFIEKVINFCDKNKIDFGGNKSILFIDPIKSRNLYDDIVRVIDSSYQIASKTVNYALIQRNWLIGKRIVENEISNRKDDYGKGVIKELSNKLTSK